MDADFFLISRMKQGQEKAFDLFVEKYYKAILTYCNYRYYDKNYVEDLTQETFVRFFLNYLITIMKEKQKIIYIQ